MIELDKLKTELQRKTEALEAIITIVNMGGHPALIRTQAQDVLLPVFVPKVGKLYMVKAHHGSNPRPTYWIQTYNIKDYHEVRELTRQEWIDLGCTVKEVTMEYAKPQLTITEEEAYSLKQYAIDCCVSEHGEQILKLLDGAKVKSKANKLDTLFKDTKLANEAMNICVLLSQSINTSQTPSMLKPLRTACDLGKRIHEAKEKE